MGGVHLSWVRGSRQVCSNCMPPCRLRPPNSAATCMNLLSLPDRPQNLARESSKLEAVMRHKQQAGPQAGDAPAAADGAAQAAAGGAAEAAAADGREELQHRLARLEAEVQLLRMQQQGPQQRQGSQRQQQTAVPAELPGGARQQDAGGQGQGVVAQLRAPWQWLGSRVGNWRRPAAPSLASHSSSSDSSSSGAGGEDGGGVAAAEGQPTSAAASAAATMPAASPPAAQPTAGAVSAAAPELERPAPPEQQRCPRQPPATAAGWLLHATGEPLRWLRRHIDKQDT